MFEKQLSNFLKEMVKKVKKLLIVMLLKEIILI